MSSRKAQYVEESFESSLVSYSAFNSHRSYIRHVHAISNHPAITCLVLPHETSFEERSSRIDRVGALHIGMVHDCVSAPLKPAACSKVRVLNRRYLKQLISEHRTSRTCNTYLRTCVNVNCVYFHMLRGRKRQAFTCEQPCRRCQEKASNNQLQHPPPDIISSVTH